MRQWNRGRPRRWPFIQGARFRAYIVGLQPTTDTFHLPHGQLPVVSRRPIRKSQRERNPPEPFTKEQIYLLRAQRIADLLQLLRIVTASEAVIERLTFYAGFLQLPFRPFMAVDTDFDSPRCVTAHLYEDRSEVLVINMEIVLLQIDRRATTREGVSWCPGWFPPGVKFIPGEIAWPLHSAPMPPTLLPLFQDWEGPGTLGREAPE